MMIIDSTDSAHTISVYVRKEVTTCDSTLINEASQVETSASVTGTYDSGIFTFNITHTFKNRRFYMLELKSGGVLINRSKIFATSQTDLEKYDMNEDYYQTISKDERTFSIKE